MFLRSMKPWRKNELQPWKKDPLWTHHNSFSHKREPKHTNDTARLLQTQSDVHVHETASNKKAVKKMLPHLYIILDNSTLLCVTPKVNNIKKEKEKCKCLPHRAPVVCKLLSLSILYFAYLASLPCATLDMNAVSCSLWQLLVQDLISQSFASCQVFSQ